MTLHFYKGLSLSIFICASSHAHGAAPAHFKHYIIPYNTFRSQALGLYKHYLPFGRGQESFVILWWRFLSPYLVLIHA